MNRLRVIGFVPKGELVGEDHLGNKYYENKDRLFGGHRFVDYASGRSNGGVSAGYVVVLIYLTKPRSINCVMAFEVKTITQLCLSANVPFPPSPLRLLLLLQTGLCL